MSDAIVIRIPKSELKYAGKVVFGGLLTSLVVIDLIYWGHDLMSWFHALIQQIGA